MKLNGEWMMVVAGGCWSDSNKLA